MYRFSQIVPNTIEQYCDFCIIKTTYYYSRQHLHQQNQVQ